MARLRRWLPLKPLLAGCDRLGRVFAYVPGAHPNATKRNALVLLVYLIGLLAAADLLVGLL
jgi:hypothetical protein